jgi:hypothetical protein
MLVQVTVIIDVVYLLCFGSLSACTTVTGNPGNHGRMGGHDRWLITLHILSALV